MNSFFHINVFFLVLFITSNTYAQNQIVADLSQENVEISTDFQIAIPKAHTKDIIQF